MKVCTGCEAEKPVQDFYADRSRPDGYSSRCKTCKCSSQRSYHEKNRPARNAAVRARRAADPEPHRASSRKWKRENPEAASASAKRYYAENREAVLSRVADYYRRHPDRVRASSEAAEAKRPEFYRAIARECSSRRRALRRGAVSLPFTAEQLVARMRYFGNLCWMCGEEADTVDHVKPLSAGGPHMLANLRPACRSCNCRKRDQWPFPAVGRTAA